MEIYLRMKPRKTKLPHPIVTEIKEFAERRPLTAGIGKIMYLMLPWLRSQLRRKHSKIWTIS
jgi:hypothetical protein